MNKFFSCAAGLLLFVIQCSYRHPREDDNLIVHIFRSVHAMKTKIALFDLVKQYLFILHDSFLLM
jgi:hypothetical protein